MRSDIEIKNDVEEELNWDPDLNGADIAVTVKNGVVELAGYVHRFRQRMEAEADAKRVAGVLAVANDIEVRLPFVHRRPDPEIARDVADALRRELQEVADSVKATVEDGWVTLDGELEWDYLRERAADAISNIKGVKTVRNFIKLKPSVPTEVVKRGIEEAFRRNAALDAKRIEIEINGGEVALNGTVRSWVERQEAERIAWSTPGVTKVENRLLVNPALAAAA